ncbi:MAG: helicase [Deltaproteobacteria bacterium]|nr:MAG: helicase [Deltaproteobacteria bacterium]
MSEDRPTMTVAAQCLLTGITLPLEREIKRQLTIDNPQYRAAKKYGRWIGKGVRPELKYYQPVPGGLRFPRGFANQAVLLCREMLGCDPRIVDQRRLAQEIEICFRGSLRNYQQEAVDKALSRSFGVIEAGTGSGKTVMALALVAARRQPSLVIVHTKELLYQWQARVQEFLGVEPALIGDGRFALAAVTIAIVNTARKRLQELVPHFGQLIVDECHRVPANLFTDVVSSFDCHYLLGLSATAFRSDNELTKLIYFYMGDRIHRVDKRKLVATGAILAPEIIRSNTCFTYRYRGDYQALIKALVTHEGRNQQIIDDIVMMAREPDCGTILVVSDRVSHCQLFADKLQARGLRVALLTGKVAPELRAAIVDEVQTGKVDVLAATLQLISEGFDCSGLSTLFLTTPISFEGRLLQVIGRIMRPAENKRARVFDYVDQNIPTLVRSARARALVLSDL